MEGQQIHASAKSKELQANTQSQRKVAPYFLLPQTHNDF